MDQEAKVKYRGIQIGKVEDITYTGDQAKLTLAIKRGQLRYVPSNALVRIGSTTVFGAKSVEFMLPLRSRSRHVAAPAAPPSAAEAVQLEANTPVPDIDRRAGQGRPNPSERDHLGDRRGLAWPW